MADQISPDRPEADLNYPGELTTQADGEPPLSGGHDNLGTMATIFAIYESARNGTAVDVDI